MCAVSHLLTFGVNLLTCAEVNATWGHTDEFHACEARQWHGLRFCVSVFTYAFKTSHRLN